MNSDLVDSVCNGVRVVRNTRLKIYLRRPDIEDGGGNLKVLGVGAELKIQVVRNASVLRIAQLAILVGKDSNITLSRRLEVDIGTEIMQVGLQRNLAVVVIDFAIRDCRMADGQIEHARVTAAFTRRSDGKIVFSYAAGLDVDNRMIDQQFAQRDLTMQC